MTAPRLGICFVPTLAPEALRALALAADRHLDDLWVWEDCFKESGVAASAAALAWTDRVRVGLGLMPAPLRVAPLAAMEIATLYRMFPGRFVPGVGHGVQPWMGQCGVRATSPMTLLEEYLAALRELLAGHEVTVDGDYVHLDAVRLEWPPAAGERLMAGGSGPRTLALVGRRSDGLLTGAGLTDDELSAQVRLVLRAREDEGLDASPDGFEVVHTVILATGPGAQERVDSEVQVWRAQTGPNRGVAGSAEAVADRIRGMTERGVTTVVAQPTADEPDLQGLVAFLGEQVRPLL